MKCKKCNKVIDDQYLFCPFCGTKAEKDKEQELNLSEHKSNEHKPNEQKLNEQKLNEKKTREQKLEETLKQEFSEQEFEGKELERKKTEIVSNTLTKIYSMDQYDNQDVLGDYRLYIEEGEIKGKYKFELFKKNRKHSYSRGEKILSVKREKDEKVISNIIVWSEYIYFVKSDSFNRVSVVKIKINGKKMTPLIGEMEFESLMKQRGYSNSHSIGYIKLFLKNEKLYMASIVNQKCFSLDYFDRKKHIECVNSCEFNGQPGKKYELIGLNEEGNVALLINNTDKNSIIKIDNKESKTIDMNILEQKLSNLFSWFEYKFFNSIEHFIDKQYRQKIVFEDTYDKILYCGSDDIYIKINIKREYDNGAMRSIFFNHPFFEYFDQKRDKRESMAFWAIIEPIYTDIHIFEGIIRIKDKGEIIECMPVSKFNGEDMLNTNKCFLELPCYDKLMINPFSSAIYAQKRITTAEDMREVKANYERIMQNLTAIEQNHAMAEEKDKFWEQKVNLNHINVLHRDMENKYWIVDCDLCDKRQILKVSFDGKRIASKLQSSWDYEHPDFSGFEPLEISEKPEMPITPIPYEDEQSPGFRLQVFNSKKLFEVGNYVYECNDKKQNKWYWQRKNSAKKMPIYELNQYDYNVEVIQIYKGAIYFKADDFQGNWNLYCLQDGETKKIMRLSDEVVDIVIYNNKIFLSKFHDGTDRSDGFIPVTNGEIEEYYQYNSGEITIYNIDGKYLRKLWERSGFKSHPPKVTSVNQNEIVFGNSIRFRYELTR